MSVKKKSDTDPSRGESTKMVPVVRQTDFNDPDQWPQYEDESRRRGIEVQRIGPASSQVRFTGRNWIYHRLAAACEDRLKGATRVSDEWCARERVDPSLLERWHENLGRWMKNCFVRLRTEIELAAEDTVGAPAAPTMPRDTNRVGTLSAATAAMTKLAAHARKLERLELSHLAGHATPSPEKNRVGGTHQRETMPRRRRKKGLADIVVAKYLCTNGFRGPTLKITHQETGFPVSSIQRTTAWKQYTELRKQDPSRKDFAEQLDHLARPDDALKQLIDESKADMNRDETKRPRRAR